MKIAIMQPYLFPYIGYFQLINAVDKFIVYNDVNYIVKGWINRNRILVNGNDYLFTVPLINASKNKLIKDIQVSIDIKWKEKFLKTVALNYKKAPNYGSVGELIYNIINSEYEFISGLVFNSLLEIIKYLDISTLLKKSSDCKNDKSLKGQDKIIDICLKENADHYINPINGVNLYSKDSFSERNMEISFLKTKTIKYKQLKNDFISNLSIIDVLMFNSKDKIQEYLQEYELI